MEERTGSGGFSGAAGRVTTAALSDRVRLWDDGTAAEPHSIRSVPSDEISESGRETHTRPAAPVNKTWRARRHADGVFWFRRRPGRSHGVEPYCSREPLVQRPATVGSVQQKNIPNFSEGAEDVNEQNRECVLFLNASSC